MTQLPSEAGDFDSGPFEPDDDWLASAPKELQIAAMRRWFLDRYEDPANETPWDGEDKEYVFVWGGPYDPNDEIQSRFDGIVEFNTMRELIEELWREVGDKWAPIEQEGVDYDDYVSHLVVIDRGDPNRFLEERIVEIFAVLEAAVLDGANNRLLHQMAHSFLIVALEAYLADTVSYWVEKDERALRRFVSTNKDFQARSLTVAELFERLERVRTTRVSKANHELSLWLDEPGGWQGACNRKYLFADHPPGGDPGDWWWERQRVSRRIGA